jgi:hypothetical protein
MMRQYLGDGVYVDFELDAQRVVLTTENGYAVTNTIYLETEVINALDLWLRDLTMVLLRKTEKGD